MTVVVLGGGLTGLATAHNLLQAGRRVEIVERSDAAGGLAGTVKRDGYYFDYGPHLFHTRNPETKRFFDEVVGPDVFEIVKNNQINFRGKYFDYPLKAPNVVKNLPIGMALRCAVDFGFATLKRALFKQTCRNAEEWIAAHFGRGLYELYFGPYTQKVWGRPPSALAASFAQHRIPPISVRDLILNYFKIKDRGPAKNEHKFAPNVYNMFYPHKGSGVFTDRLTERVVAGGGVVHLEATPVSVEMDGGRAVAVEFVKGGQTRRIEEVDFLISTIPVPSLFPLLRPAPPEPVLRAAASLEYRAIAILCLMVRKRPVIRHATVYFMDKFFNRISDLTRYSPHVAPEGRSALSVEITCGPEEMEKWTDGEILENSLRGLVEEGYLTRDEVEGSFVLRVKNGYPVYSVAYEGAMKTIGDHLSGCDNLLIAGRNGYFKYVDMHICVEAGRAMRDYILSGKTKRQFRDDGVEIYFA